MKKQDCFKIAVKAGFKTRIFKFNKFKKNYKKYCVRFITAYNKDKLSIDIYYVNYQYDFCNPGSKFIYSFSLKNKRDNLANL